MPSSQAVGRFASTSWDLVLRSRAADPEVARAALADLCGRYWYPLYTYVRGRAGSADAADLTQGFFVRLLESDLFATADRTRGRLRGYLLGSCQHFLANERERAAALKRGGGVRFRPLDFGDADARYAHEPADRLSPESASSTAAGP